MTKSEVHVECSPVHAVALVTGTSRGLTRIGRAVTEASFDVADTARLSWSEVDPEPWFRIVVIDGAGKRAWTNPIWLDELG